MAENNKEKNNVLPEAASSASSSLRRSRSWCSERMISIFSSTLTEEISTQAADLIRRRRVVDFMISSGRVSAKVFDDLSRPLRIEILFKQYAKEKWERIFGELAKQGYFLAVLLSGHLPPEIEDIFSRHGAELFPSSLDKLAIAVNGQRHAPVTKHVAAVIYRLCEKLDDDPFSIFVLHGRGREETLLEIRKRRSLHSEAANHGMSLSYQDVKYEPAPPLVSTMDHFWTSGGAALELSYSIKADELPASVLKWLDPLPLGGLEDRSDVVLEQAYEKVARLAQGFGLGLQRKSIPLIIKQF
jgi:uncharacterized Zn finger protein